MHLHSHAGVRFTDDVERLLAASSKDDEAEETATAQRFAAQEYKPESYRDYMMRLSGGGQAPVAPANVTAPTGLAAKGCPTCGGAAANTTAAASCPTCGQNNQTAVAQQAPLANATAVSAAD